MKLEAVEIPDGLGQSILQVLSAANPEHDDIHFTLLVVQDGCPPSVLSSIHPDELPHFLTFCAQHQAGARVEVSDGSIGEKH